MLRDYAGILLVMACAADGFGCYGIRRDEVRYAPGDFMPAVDEGVGIFEYYSGKYFMDEDEEEDEDTPHHEDHVPDTQPQKIKGVGALSIEFMIDEVEDFIEAEKALDTLEHCSGRYLTLIGGYSVSPQEKGYILVKDARVIGVIDIETKERFV